MSTGDAGLARPSASIVWINGPFGVGKSSTGDALRDANPEWAAFDPELLAPIAALASPNREFGDFQDLPAWRTLAGAMLERIAALNAGGTVLVPMTMSNKAYASEVFTPSCEAGSSLVVVTLTAQLPALLSRIDADVTHPSGQAAADRTRIWRRNHARSFTGVDIPSAEEQLTIDTTQTPITRVVSLIENALERMNRR